MADSNYRDRFMLTLIEHVREDTYPSKNQMDLVESMLPPHQLDFYLEVLLQKIESEAVALALIARAAQGSLRWRPVTRCRQSTHCANLP